MCFERTSRTLWQTRLKGKLNVEGVMGKYDTINMGHSLDLFSVVLQLAKCREYVTESAGTFTTMLNLIFHLRLLVQVFSWTANVQVFIRTNRNLYTVWGTLIIRVRYNHWLNICQRSCTWSNNRYAYCFPDVRFQKITLVKLEQFLNLQKDFV